MHYHDMAHVANEPPNHLRCRQLAFPSRCWCAFFMEQGMFAQTIHLK